MAWEKGDMETARRLAHTIKGVSGNVGAEEVQREAASLESVIKNGDEGLFPNNTNRLMKRSMWRFGYRRAPEPAG